MAKKWETVAKFKTGEAWFDEDYHEAVLADEQNPLQGSACFARFPTRARTTQGVERKYLGRKVRI